MLLFPLLSTLSVITSPVVTCPTFSLVPTANPAGTVTLYPSIVSSLFAVYIFEYVSFSASVTFAVIDADFPFTSIPDIIYLSV